MKQLFKNCWKTPLGININMNKSVLTHTKNGMNVIIKP